jgi:hypothetical protein
VFEVFAGRSYPRGSKDVVSTDRTRTRLALTSGEGLSGSCLIGGWANAGFKVGDIVEETGAADGNIEAAALGICAVVGALVVVGRTGAAV